MNKFQKKCKRLSKNKFLQRKKRGGGGELRHKSHENLTKLQKKHKTTKKQQNPDPKPQEKGKKTENTGFENYSQIKEVDYCCITTEGRNRRRYRVLFPATDCVCVQLLRKAEGMHRRRRRRERRRALYVWGREGKEARAAVGVTKGVRRGKHQRKHIRIMDPPPLSLLSLSLSLSPDWILFILPRNSTALLLFRDYTDFNPAPSGSQRMRGNIPAGCHPRNLSSWPVRNVFKQPRFSYTQLRPSTCMPPKNRPRTSGSFMKPCWFFEVFENNQLEPVSSFSFFFFFPKELELVVLSFGNISRIRTNPWFFSKSSKNRPTTGQN